MSVPVDKERLLGALKRQVHIDFSYSIYLFNNVHISLYVHVLFLHRLCFYSFPYYLQAVLYILKAIEQIALGKKWYKLLESTLPNPSLILMKQKLLTSLASSILIESPKGTRYIL